MAEVLFSLQLPFKITKRAKWFLATCPIIDVHSQGETEKKAKENLIEALSLFFVSCFERGTLDVVLKDCGFRARRITTYSVKRPSVPKENYIDVPIPFQIDKLASNACHA